MTPREKALELVNNFYLNGIQDEEYSMEYDDGKKCALICVDEMIKELTEEISPSIHGFRHNYWKEVKQEINKL
tara:strand:+ start:119 stop:337 length:219 start_codon:yes stop_codon:yes gene_type:complete